MPTYRTVFISHAHADNARCARIADKLRARGLDVWIDLTNMQQGHDLGAEIREQLKRRTAFVLIVTATSNASHWVGLERGAYMSLANTAATCFVHGVARMILPVRLSDEVPVILRGIQWIDAVGKLDDVVASEIAAALVIGERRDPPPPSPSPPPTEWEEIGIPTGLHRLGFRGWRVRKTGMEFILPPTCHVVAGAFDMGSTDTDKEAKAYEKPQYRIPVGAFAIGTFPVTVAEYAYYLKANPGVDAPPAYTYPKHASWLAKKLRGASVTWDVQRQRPDHPVMCVSWFSGRDYAAWLGRTTGQPWRLPTEAEWEKAARWDVAAQHARIYPWGDTFDKTRANTQEGGPKRTTAVGRYPSGASPYGAQDMAGNVWEWCSTIYHERYPYDPATWEDLNDRKSVRVLRGGAWYLYARVARAAFRVRLSPIVCGNFSGFRVARPAAGT
jgi:formylglycine-generating enzyme required for sulfatase activity